jgi:hypothetical protein
MVTTSSGLRRRLFVVACTLLLLFAQHTALAHALWHALGNTPAQHEQSHDTPKSAGGLLCTFDAAIGQVLGCGAAVTTCVFYAQSADVAPVAPGFRVVLSSRFLAPLSRGPPALS